MQGDVRAEYGLTGDLHLWKTGGYQMDLGPAEVPDGLERQRVWSVVLHYPANQRTGSSHTSCFLPKAYRALTSQ